MGKNKNRGWLGLVAAGLMAVVLSGCGGSDGAAGPAGQTGATGPTGPAGPAGPAGPGGNLISVGSNTATNPTVVNANAAVWAALEPTVTVTGVTIASPPVVNFKVTDAFGKPIVGLGNTSKADTAKFASYPNLAFSLAKLVPGANGNPSKWVSYIVTTVENNSTASAPGRPTTDNTGTLVDNGDGTYKYTFYRDVTQIKAQVAAMTVSGTNNKADLGDLTYDPTLTHRLTIELAGFAPGTGASGERGINTPKGAASSFAGVPLRKPYNAIYDFIPATGSTTVTATRDIVANANCENCHRKLLGIPGLSSAEDAASVHSSSRNNVQYCVVCHTGQRKYGRTEATYNAATLTFTGSTNVVDGRSVFDLPNMIHKYHMGPLLSRKGYNPSFAETTYPQDIRNCQNCHDGSATARPLITKTKDGDNWKKVPSALACGACHDGINFVTGVGVTLRDAAKGLTSTNILGSGFAHAAGPQPDDSNCAQCHKSTGTFPTADIDLSHFPVTPPSEGSFLHIANGSGNTNTNSAFIASNLSRLPPGAIKVTYDVKSAAVLDVGGKKRPVLVFRMLQDGVRKDLNVHDSTAPSPVTGAREFWDGFMGAPSVYFVWSVAQDGIAAPSDFNASVSAYLRCLWNNTATIADPGECTAGGTLTGPDAGGYYTATLTGAEVPAGAQMLYGGLGYSYNVRTTMPLTQINLANYPTSASPVAVGATKETATSTQLIPGFPNRIGGLIVIQPNAQVLGRDCGADATCVADATKGTAYTARRAIVEDKRCNACHQELGTFTEDAFHAGQRNDGTTCSWCHTPNRTSSAWSADSTAFVHAIHAAAKRSVPYNWHAVSATENFSEVAYPGILNDCETCHVPGSYDFRNSASAAAADNRLYRTVGTGTYAASVSLSPYVALATNYGSGFSYNAATGVTTAAAATTLVTSPTVTVCSACHDTADAISHYKINGGAFYAARGTAITGTNETCLVCHGPERIADIKVMHSKNR